MGQHALSASGRERQTRRRIRTAVRCECAHSQQLSAQRRLVYSLEECPQIPNGDIMPALDDVPTRQNAAHKMTKNVCRRRWRKGKGSARRGKPSAARLQFAAIGACPSQADHSHDAARALSVCLTETVERDHEHRDAHEQSAELQRQTDDRQPQRCQHARRGGMIVAGGVADGQGIGDVVLLCSEQTGSRRAQTKPDHAKRVSSRRLASSRTQRPAMSGTPPVACGRALGPSCRRP